MCSDSIRAKYGSGIRSGFVQRTSTSSESPVPSAVSSSSVSSSLQHPSPGPSSYCSPSASSSSSSSTGGATPLRRTHGSDSTSGFEFKTPQIPTSRSSIRSLLASEISRGGDGGGTSTTTSGKFSVPGTPRSSTGSSRTLAESVDSHVILAIVEGRGQARGEVGMACIKLNTSTVTLCQFSDTQTYTKVIAKVNIYRPFEILMPTTCCEGTGTPSQLYLQLRNEVSNVAIVPIQRRIFSEAKGYTKLKEIVAEQFAPVIHLITQKYYCLSAAAAVLKYVELSQLVIFSPRAMKVEFQGSEKTCMIDTVTAQHLELLQSNHKAAGTHSLLGILSNCRTPGGSRLLRMNILQPPYDLKLIQTRLDCIEELMESREILHGLQDLLGRFSVDIELVISSLSQIPRAENERLTEQKINYMIGLKHTLELLPNFVTVLESVQNPFFQSIREDFKSPVFQEMFEKIQQVLDEEAHVQKGSVNMKRQRCFAVKADVNPILDIARSAYIEILNDMNEYVQSVSQEHNLPIRLGQSNNRGYYLQLSLSGRGDKMPDFPKTFLQVRKVRNNVSFTTEVLVMIDHRIQKISTEIEHISSIVITELLATVRPEICSLYKISEAIANLDILYALAHYSLTTLRTVRPQFSDHATSITMGRHPVLENAAENPPVPNNTLLTTDTNFNIITGPNMSGKTTYLKQVATLQILAQLGSFVPADSATFRLANNIFSRIGTGDNIEGKSSSFQLEMTEMNYILSNVENTSLVIIDELGRATSVEEGTSISWAIAEALIQTKAFVLFATHYLFLTKLETMYPNVINYAMEAQEWVKCDEETGQDASNAESSSRVFNSSKLKYTHTLKRGVTKVEFYGLKLANSMSYPSHVVKRAAEIAETITGVRKKPEVPIPTNEGPPRQAMIMLASQLYLASQVAHAVSQEDLRTYLKSLQQEFIAKHGRPVEAANDTDASQVDESEDDQDVDMSSGMSATVSSDSSSSTMESIATPTTGCESVASTKSEGDTQSQCI